MRVGRRDASYAFKVLSEFVRFFRRPEHWRTLEDVKRFIGDKREGIFGDLMSTSTFQARWKEELVCTGPGGTFVLELPMGRLSAFLPTEDAWQKKAPAWARDLWPVLKLELESWCRVSKADLVVDESAQVC